MHENRLTVHTGGPKVFVTLRVYVSDMGTKNSVYGHICIPTYLLTYLEPSRRVP